MNRSTLPPYRPCWRYDLYKALRAALLVPPLAQRGEGRARELYRQALLIAERTQEPLSWLVWELATLESKMRAHESAAEESKESSQQRASPHTDFPVSKHPKNPNPSPQLF